MTQKYYQPLDMLESDWELIKNYVMVNYILNQETLLSSYHLTSVPVKQALKSMVQQPSLSTLSIFAPCL